MTAALGKISFLDTPDVNGVPLITESDVAAGMINPQFTGTGGLLLPGGTTAQRPVSAAAGTSRYNTTLAEPEVYSNGAWLPYARVIQSVAGTIASNNSTPTAKTSVVNAPTTTDRGFQIWTSTFTPLVAGSSIVIQYSITASHSSATARSLFTSAWVNTTCIAAQAGGGVVAAGTTVGVGAVNLVMQAVYTSTGTSAITITGWVGHLLAAGGTATLYVNQIGSTANTTFGGLLANEFRILEII